MRAVAAMAGLAGYDPTGATNYPSSSSSSPKQAGNNNNRTDGDKNSRAKVREKKH